ncbi:MAG TPA: presqualene diphosphate synthase HpnD [Alphaproteobacteria bacterium]|nr:presqualene diphosphate synthase HpnD [Alphaproteobacteria bacterium]
MADTAPILDPTDQEARDHVNHVVAASGTSFLAGMKVLPPDRRAAMFAIYAFCREIDDIADEPAPQADKMRRLAAWRAEIDRLYAGRPSLPTARALLGPVRQFGLARQDFLALIEGMEIDAAETLRLPTLAALEYYCDRVACAVGRLSVRVFGAPEPTGTAVAFALGQALQLTNILRDLQEDATRGRLYLPEEMLERHGIAAREPAEVLAHPALPRLCDELAALARRRFAEAESAIARGPRRALRPAIIMMHVYRRILDRLEARGWTQLDQPVAVGKAAKLWIALRHGLL